MSSEGKDSGLYNDAAFFTTVLGLTVPFRFKGRKITAFHTVNLIALRTVTIFQFVFINGEMTMAAAKLFGFWGEQNQALVVTGGHGHRNKDSFMSFNRILYGQDPHLSKGPKNKSRVQILKYDLWDALQMSFSGEINILTL